MTTYIYRPNSDATPPTGSPFGAVYPTSPTTHFDKVDDVTADEDATYLQSTHANQCDLFTISNPGIPPTVPPGIASITNVKICARAKNLSPGIYSYLYAFLYFGSYPLMTSAGLLTDSYAEYSISYPMNPNTGLPWAADELDGLVIGVGAYDVDSRVTQVWVEIEWGITYPTSQPEYLLKSWLDSGIDSKVDPDALIKRDLSDAKFEAEFEMTETNLKQLFATEDLDLVFIIKKVRVEPIIRGGQTIGYRHFIGIEPTAINKFVDGVLNVEASEMIALGLNEVRRILREEKDTGGTIVESQEQTAFQRPGSQLLWGDTVIVRYDKYIEQGVVTLTIQPDPDNPTWGSTTPANGSYAHGVGDVVVVTAMPTEGYGFYHWVLDGYNHSENPITVLMDSSHVIYPVWTMAD